MQQPQPLGKGLEVFDSKGRRYSEEEFNALRALIETPIMQTLKDMQHFVLQPGETLILRYTRHIPADALQKVRDGITRLLPNRPVIVLPPDVEVMAGEIEVFGAGSEHPAQDEIEALRKTFMDAYDAGKVVQYQSIHNTDPFDWYDAHKVAAPHMFNWELFNYRLPKPSRR